MYRVDVHVPICFVIALFFFISRCCDRKGIQKGKFLFQFRLDIRRSLVSALPERGLIPEQRLVIEPTERALMKSLSTVQITKQYTAASEKRLCRLSFEFYNPLVIERHGNEPLG